MVESWSQGIVESWSPGIVESRAIRQPAVSFLTAIHSPNPSPSPPLLSHVHSVFVSISMSTSSSQYRRDTFSKSVSFPFVSQSSPPCTHLDIYLNVYLTISSIHPPIRSFVFPLVFPTFPSAIFNFYHLAFVNVPSYSVLITFNLFSTRFSTPTHPPLLVSSPIISS